MQIYSWPIFLFALSVSVFSAVLFPWLFTFSDLLWSISITLRIVIFWSPLAHYITFAVREGASEAVTFPPHIVLVGGLLRAAEGKCQARLPFSRQRLHLQLQRQYTPGRGKGRITRTSWSFAVCSWSFAVCSGRDFAVGAGHRGRHFVRNSDQQPSCPCWGRMALCLGPPELLFH